MAQNFHQMPMPKNKIDVIRVHTPLYPQLWPILGYDLMFLVKWWLARLPAKSHASAMEKACEPPELASSLLAVKRHHLRPAHIEII